jgi:hypothetical protein
VLVVDDGTVDVDDEELVPDAGVVVEVGTLVVDVEVELVDVVEVVVGVTVQPDRTDGVRPLSEAPGHPVLPAT